MLSWLFPPESKSGGCPIDHHTNKSNGNASQLLNKDNLMYPEETLQSPPTFSCSFKEQTSNGTTAVMTAAEGGDSLSPARVLSSIPRTDSHENWKYPSEQMFFNAMHRKGYDPDSRDMQTVVMMHNIVNEQTWQELKKWEKEFHCDCEEITLKRFR